jgi:hypothetical protein
MSPVHRSRASQSPPTRPSIRTPPGARATTCREPTAGRALAGRGGAVRVARAPPSPSVGPSLVRSPSTPPSPWFSWVAVAASRSPQIVESPSCPGSRSRGRRNQGQRGHFLRDKYFRAIESGRRRPDRGSPHVVNGRPRGAELRRRASAVAWGSLGGRRGHRNTTGAVVGRRGGWLRTRQPQPQPGGCLAWACSVLALAGPSRQVRVSIVQSTPEVRTVRGGW